jgi:hypothetical protein
MDMTKLRENRPPAAIPMPQILSAAMNEKRNHSRWILRTAASFFLVALLSIVYISISRQEGDNQIDIPNPTTESSYRAIRQPGTPSKKVKDGTPTTQVTVARNQVNRTSESTTQNGHNDFAINPNLEYMINSQSRNSGILVHAPHNDSKLSGAIEFVWTTSSKRKLQLKILNNQNEILYSYSPDGGQLTMTDPLQPGLYYWKLEDQTDLFYVGKFLIPEPSTSRPE